MNFEKKYELAVVGGGIAGVAAALAAARAGKKTVLLEKTLFLGGLATSGLIYIYLPLCDGNGTQVTFGICEELINLSLKYGPGDIPKDWKNKKNASEPERYRCIFSPASFILALDEVLQEAGVDIWLDTLVCDVQLDDDNRLRALEIENESGRGILSADCFIDASGSGIVARRAGVPCTPGDNFLAIWALEYDERVKTSEGLANHVNMYIGGKMSFETGTHAELIRGINGRLVSKFTLAGHKLLRERYLKEYKSGKADRKSLFPLHLPVQSQFRKIFAVNGAETLTSDQYSTFMDNSIGLVADWRKPGFVWEIPFGTLLPQKVKGLLTAGRCISSIDDAWEITRVIPTAALTGEVAGTAAAMAHEQGIMPDELDIKTLQEKLKKSGIPLHLADVGL
ncbi:MAG: FAD-dependent oxidoreductase [Victivallales bacterium]